MSSKTLLQTVMSFLLLLPLYFSVQSLVTGLPLDINSSDLVVLDSGFRYRGGIYFGFALCLAYGISIVDRIDTTIFKLLCFAFFCGGIGRLLSMAAHGIPNWQILMFTILELSIVLFIPWQKSIYKKSANLK